MLLFKNRMPKRRGSTAHYLSPLVRKLLSKVTRRPVDFLVLRELLRNFYDATALNRKFICLEGKGLLSIDQR